MSVFKYVIIVLVTWFISILLNWVLCAGHRFILHLSWELTVLFLPAIVTLSIGYSVGWCMHHFDWNPWMVCALLVIVMFLGAAAWNPEDRVGMTLLVFDEFNSTRPRFTGPVLKTAQELFEERCATITSAYGLTAREAEILAILAKGYNAQYISDSLVISKHTTKTHIYHIYQKIGINSQQELIAMMDVDSGE